MRDPTLRVEVTNWSLEKLIKKFVEKDIRLPEMQRKYVWTREKVRALIDSLYKDYPSGSILLWNTSDPPKTRDVAIATEESENGGESYLLLDGQQRLTSLSAIITGATIKTRKNRTVKDSKIELCFNVNHPDNLIDSDTAGEDLDDENGNDEHIVFKLKNPAIASNPYWIDVTQLFKKDPVTVLEENIDSKDPGYKKYLQRLNTLYNKLTTYTYPVQILDRSSSYAEVADIFVRINSQGSKSRKSDLALAQVTSRWDGSMDLFSSLSEECREKGHDLDEGFLIKCLMSVSTGQSRFKNIGNTPTRQIQNSWEDTKMSLQFVIDFLKNNAGVETAEILPVKFLIIPLVCIAAKHDCRFPPDLERAATRWFYAALMWGRYSKGSTETVLDEDLGLIRDYERPIEPMMEKIRLQSGRLDVKEEDLAVSSVKNPFFSMMYILARNANAKDWHSGLVISADTNSGLRHKWVFDHGLLKDSLQKKHDNAKKMRQLSSEIANIVFVDKYNDQNYVEPQEYLKDVVESRGESVLDAQCVPADPVLWQVEMYEEFLKSRRQAIATSINDLMESLERDDHAQASDSDVISKGETALVEFKSSLFWDYRQNKKNDNLADVVMKAVTAFLNAHGGTVYVGVSDDGSILGLDKDYKCMSRHRGWDGWSQSFVNALKKIGKEWVAYVSHDKIVVDGKEVAKITVKKSKSPVYVDPFGRSEFNVRVGTANQTFNSKQTAEYVSRHFERPGA